MPLFSSASKSRHGDQGDAGGSSSGGRRRPPNDPRRLKWTPLDGPSTRERLLAMMLDMYWVGVRREIKHILLSLGEMRDVEPTEVERQRQREEDEEDKAILAGEKGGAAPRYGTFIDQVCEMPRVQEDVVKEAPEPQPQTLQDGNPNPYLSHLLLRRPLRTETPTNSSRLREAVAARLKASERQTDPSIQHARARGLLQAAGFLDIDKLVEYRVPEETYNVVTRGQVPQRGLFPAVDCRSPAHG
ncbi:hypothetical protein VTK73DRAFT_2469 [Phialemonium thermophilum]|uniref:Uncharacterized protein n=1 Tax=Phialemonium thermophilum TaxID=223376 RepID=A0ABR3VS21_9PEZI